MVSPFTVRPASRAPSRGRRRQQHRLLASRRPSSRREAEDYNVRRVPIIGMHSTRRERPSRLPRSDRVHRPRRCRVLDVATAIAARTAPLRRRRIGIAKSPVTPIRSRRRRREIGRAHRREARNGSAMKARGQQQADSSTIRTSLASVRSRAGAVPEPIEIATSTIPIVFARRSVRAEVRREQAGCRSRRRGCSVTVTTIMASVGSGNLRIFRERKRGSSAAL